MKLPRKKASRKTSSAAQHSLILDNPKSPPPSRNPTLAKRMDISSYVVPFRRVIE